MKPKTFKTRNSALVELSSSDIESLRPVVDRELAEIVARHPTADVNNERAMLMANATYELAKSKCVPGDFLKVTLVTV